MRVLNKVIVSLSVRTQIPFKLSFVASKLKSTLQTLYCHHHELAERYEISISQITRLLQNLSMCNTAGVLLETGTVYPSRGPGFTYGFLWGSCC